MASFFVYKLGPRSCLWLWERFCRCFNSCVRWRNLSFVSLLARHPPFSINSGAAWNKGDALGESIPKEIDEHATKSFKFFCKSSVREMSCAHWAGKRWPWRRKTRTEPPSMNILVLLWSNLWLFLGLVLQFYGTFWIPEVYLPCDLAKIDSRTNKNCQEMHWAHWFTPQPSCSILLGWPR